MFYSVAIRLCAYHPVTARKSVSWAIVSVGHLLCLARRIVTFGFCKWSACRACRAVQLTHHVSRYEAPEPYDLVEYTIPEPIEHRLLPEERDIDVAMPNSVLLVVGHKTNLKGIRACALHTLASVSTEDDVQRQMAFCHDHTFSLATISNRLTEWSSAHSSKRVKSDSDTTAVAFSSCGVSNSNSWIDLKPRAQPLFCCSTSSDQGLYWL